MMSSIKSFYRWVRSLGRLPKRLYWSLLGLLYKMGVLSAKDIPIVINNFNRLEYPSKLISFLQLNGFSNIIILDNRSDYPPLLEYYQSATVRIIREPKNYGHLALWHSGLYRKLRWNYFVYTDSDVVPIEECSADFMDYFRKILADRQELDKVGFGIRIDDLPDSFALKPRVVAYEQRYWETQLKPGLYDAPIDTTFAMYKPFSGLKWGESHTLKAARTDFPYLIRHLPWYVDSANLSEEEKYYVRTANSSSSMAGEHNETKKTY